MSLTRDLRFYGIVSTEDCGLKIECLQDVLVFVMRIISTIALCVASAHLANGMEPENGVDNPVPFSSEGSEGGDNKVATKKEEDVIDDEEEGDDPTMEENSIQSQLQTQSSLRGGLSRKAKVGIALATLAALYGGHQVNPVPGDYMMDGAQHYYDLSGVDAYVPVGVKNFQIRDVVPEREAKLSEWYNSLDATAYIGTPESRQYKLDRYFGTAEEREAKLNEWYNWFDPTAYTGTPESRQVRLDHWYDSFEKHTWTSKQREAFFTAHWNRWNNHEELTRKRRTMCIDLPNCKLIIRQVRLSRNSKL